MRAISLRRLLAAGLLGGSLLCGQPALAQEVKTAPGASGAVTTVAPAAALPAAASASERGAAAGLPAPQPSDTNAQRAVSQPGNNAPFWRGVRQSGVQAGTVNFPYPEYGVLIQQNAQYPGAAHTTAGEAWRQVRNHWIIPYGGSLLVIVLVAIGIFYFVKGPLGVHGDGPPTIQRFTPFERAAHWTNAVAFVLLAVSGLVMAFGKFILLPLLGGSLFGWLTYALKTMHNFVGPLFIVSLLVVFFTFVKDNIANGADFKWLFSLGGMLNRDGKQVPSHRFNAIEKGLFWWAMVFPGLIIGASGLWLNHLIPGAPVARGDMQVAHMIHAVFAMWMMAGLIGHIYAGTVGVKGAYAGMKTGWVDDGWARENHELWFEDVKAGRIPAQRAPEKPILVEPPAKQPRTA